MLSPNARKKAEAKPASWCRCTRAYFVVLALLVFVLTALQFADVVLVFDAHAYVFRSAAHARDDAQLSVARVAKNASTSAPGIAGVTYRQAAYCDDLCVAHDASDDDSLCESLASKCGLPCSRMDFVVTWVNGSNPVFQAATAERLAAVHAEGLAPPSDASKASRFRDLHMLRYNLRSVFTNANDMVRRIFVVYNDEGGTPSYVDAEHPRIRLVPRSALYEKGHPPVYNSMAIELNLHRIPTLSPTFIYSHDDLFFWNKVSTSMFVTGDGKARYFASTNCDAWEQEPCNQTSEHAIQFPYVCQVQNSWQMVTRAFGESDLLQKSGKRVLGCHDHAHMVLSHRIMEDLWKTFPEEAAANSGSAFRQLSDFQVHEAVMYLALARGWGVFDTGGAPVIRQQIMATPKMTGIAPAGHVHILNINDDLGDDPSNALLLSIMRTLDNRFPTHPPWEIDPEAPVEGRGLYGRR